MIYSIKVVSFEKWMERKVSTHAAPFVLKLKICHAVHIGRGKDIFAQNVPKINYEAISRLLLHVHHDSFMSNFSKTKQFIYLRSLIRSRDIYFSFNICPNSRLCSLRYKEVYIKERIDGTALLLT